MKSRSIWVLVLLACAAAAVVPGASVARSSQGGGIGPDGPCASAQDLDRVERGWTRQQVTKQFDYVGVRVDYRKIGGLSDQATNYREQAVRAYAGCKGAQGILVGFERKTVDGTTGAWRVVKHHSMAM